MVDFPWISSLIANYRYHSFLVYVGVGVVVWCGVVWCVCGVAYPPKKELYLDGPDLQGDKMKELLGKCPSMRILEISIRLSSGKSCEISSEVINELTLDSRAYHVDRLSHLDCKNLSKLTLFRLDVEGYAFQHMIESIVFPALFCFNGFFSFPHFFSLHFPHFFFLFLPLCMWFCIITFFILTFFFR